MKVEIAGSEHQDLRFAFGVKLAAARTLAVERRMMCRGFQALLDHWRWGRGIFSRVGRFTWRRNSILKAITTRHWRSVSNMKRNRILRLQSLHIKVINRNCDLLMASCFDVWSQTCEQAFEAKSKDNMHAAFVSRNRRRSELREMGRAFMMLLSVTLEARRMARSVKALSVRHARSVLGRYFDTWDQHRIMLTKQAHDMEEEVDASLVFHHMVLRAERRRMFFEFRLVKQGFTDLARNRVMGLHLRRRIACRCSRLLYRLLDDLFSSWKLYAVLHSCDKILTQKNTKCCSHLTRRSCLRFASIVVETWKEVLSQRVMKSLQVTGQVENIVERAQQSRDALVSICFGFLKKISRASRTVARWRLRNVAVTWYEWSRIISANRSFRITATKFVKRSKYKAVLQIFGAWHAHCKQLARALGKIRLISQRNLRCTISKTFGIWQESAINSLSRCLIQTTFKAIWRRQWHRISGALNSLREITAALKHMRRVASKIRFRMLSHAIIFAFGAWHAVIWLKAQKYKCSGALTRWRYREIAIALDKWRDIASIQREKRGKIIKATCRWRGWRLRLGLRAWHHHTQRHVEAKMRAERAIASWISRAKYQAAAMSDISHKYGKRLLAKFILTFAAYASIQRRTRQLLKMITKRRFRRAILSFMQRWFRQAIGARKDRLLLHREENRRMRALLKKYLISWIESHAMVQSVVIESLEAEFKLAIAKNRAEGKETVVCRRQLFKFGKNVLIAWCHYRRKKVRRKRIMAHSRLRSDQESMAIGFEALSHCQELGRGVRLLTSQSAHKLVMRTFKGWCWSVIDSLETELKHSIAENKRTVVCRRQLIMRTYKGWWAVTVQENALQVVEQHVSRSLHRWSSKLVRARLAATFRDFFASIYENNRMQAAYLAVYERKHRRMLRTWRQHARLSWLENRFEILQKRNRRTEFLVFLRGRIDWWRQHARKKGLRRRAIDKSIGNRWAHLLQCFFFCWHTLVASEARSRRLGSQSQSMYLCRILRHWREHSLVWHQKKRGTMRIQMRQMIFQLLVRFEKWHHRSVDMQQHRRRVAILIRRHHTTLRIRVWFIWCDFSGSERRIASIASRFQRSRRARLCRRVLTNLRHFLQRARYTLWLSKIGAHCYGRNARACALRSLVAWWTKSSRNILDFERSAFNKAAVHREAEVNKSMWQTHERQTAVTLRIVNIFRNHKRRQLTFFAWQSVVSHVGWISSHVVRMQRTFCKATLCKFHAAWLEWSWERKYFCRIVLHLRKMKSHRTLALTMKSLRRPLVECRKRRSIDSLCAARSFLRGTFVKRCVVYAWAEERFMRKKCGQGLGRFAQMKFRTHERLHFRVWAQKVYLDKFQHRVMGKISQKRFDTLLSSVFAAWLDWYSFESSQRAQNAHLMCVNDISTRNAEFARNFAQFQQKATLCRRALRAWIHAWSESVRARENQSRFTRLDQQVSLRRARSLIRFAFLNWDTMATASSKKSSQVKRICNALRMMRTEYDKHVMLKAFFDVWLNTASEQRRLKQMVKKRHKAVFTHWVAVVNSVKVSAMRIQRHRAKWKRQRLIKVLLAVANIFWLRKRIRVRVRACMLRRQARTSVLFFDLWLAVVRTKQARRKADAKSTTLIQKNAVRLRLLGLRAMFEWAFICKNRNLALQKIRSKVSFRIKHQIIASSMFEWMYVHERRMNLRRSSRKANIILQELNIAKLEGNLSAWVEWKMHCTRMARLHSFISKICERQSQHMACFCINHIRLQVCVRKASQRLFYMLVRRRKSKWFTKWEICFIETKRRKKFQQRFCDRSAASVMKRLLSSLFRAWLDHQDWVRRTKKLLLQQIMYQSRRILLYSFQGLKLEASFQISSRRCCRALEAHVFKSWSFQSIRVHFSQWNVSCSKDRRLLNVLSRAIKFRVERRAVRCWSLHTQRKKLQTNLCSKKVLARNRMCLFESFLRLRSSRALLSGRRGRMSKSDFDSLMFSLSQQLPRVFGLAQRLVLLRGAGMYMRSWRARHPDLWCALAQMQRAFYSWEELAAEAVNEKQFLRRGNHMLEGSVRRFAHRLQIRCLNEVMALWKHTYQLQRELRKLAATAHRHWQTGWMLLILDSWKQIAASPKQDSVHLIRVNQVCAPCPALALHIASPFSLCISRARARSLSLPFLLGRRRAFALSVHVVQCFCLEYTPS